MHHRFEAYKTCDGDVPRRRNGVLVSQSDGHAVGYAIWKLQERSELFVAPGDVVYEGMIVGENSRDNDMVVNPTKEKKTDQYPRGRLRRQHPAEATPRNDTRDGTRVHRGGRVRRGDSGSDPAQENPPDRERPQAESPGLESGDRVQGRPGPTLHGNR